MGILQRLSLCYGCILLLHCVTRYGTTSRKVLGSLFMVVVFVVYISFMLSWSDPDGGCPQSNNLSEECNFVGYVDRAVLTRDHIYR